MTLSILELLLYTGQPSCIFLGADWESGITQERTAWQEEVMWLESMVLVSYHCTVAFYMDHEGSDKYLYRWGIHLLG